MNTDDRLPPLDPADQEASARLDGMASAELPAGVEEADVEARRLDLGSIAALVSEPVALPSAAVVDAQIAAAIAAVSAEPAGDQTEGAAAVVALAPRRRGRMTSRRWLAVAAAVAVVALAGVVVATNRPHSSTFDTVAAPVADSGGASASSSSAPGATQSASADSRAAGVSPSPGELGASTQVVDLGAVASDASLAAEVRSEDPTLQTTTASSTTTVLTAVPTLPPSPSTTTAATPVSPPYTALVAAPSCDGSVRAAVPGLGLLVFSGTATYQGVPVEVLVYETGQPGAYQLIAAQSSDCRVLVDRPL